MVRKAVRIERFDFKPGRVLARGCYEILGQLGRGWEGEVYKVRELATGIARAAKFWYPHRNIRGETARFYAKKLHKLRDCPILIQYTHMDSITVKGVPITFLVSDFVEGEILSKFVKRQPGKRLLPFQALHMLYALVIGMEPIHLAGEYHGDLHSDNIIVSRHGLTFDLRLVDFYQRGKPTREHTQDDIVDMVQIFHEALGGRKRYAKHPPEMKAICCGLKRTLILKKFRRTSVLRAYLESMRWT
jgi:tRNA A-37 threonylcarbamoyl transferase component Bud32